MKSRIIYSAETSLRQNIAIPQPKGGFHFLQFKCLVDESTGEIRNVEYQNECGNRIAARDSYEAPMREKVAEWLKGRKREIANPETLGAYSEGFNEGIEHARPLTEKVGVCL